MTDSETKPAREVPVGQSSGRPAPDMWKAIGWVAISVLAFTLTGLAGRECGRHMSAMHMVFFRNLISLIIMLAAFRWLGISLASLKSRQPGMQWARAMVHFSGQWCWMSALLLIPLIELMALEFTAPLWVALLAPFLLGERMSKQRLIAAVLGFIGALVIILGPYFTRGSMGGVGVGLSLGSVLALTCALLFSLNIIGTRYLTRADGPLTILMFMTVNHTILAFLLGFWTMKMPMGPVVPWVLTLGVSSLVAHFALVRALAYADAVFVAPMDFLRIPLMVAMGVLLYHEPLQGIAVLGTAIVLTGNVINIWAERSRVSR